MLLELEFSQNHSGSNHPGSPGALYPNVITNGNIGTNNTHTTFEISGTQCRVDDISRNEVGSLRS